MIGSHGICLLDGDGTGMVLHTVHDTLNTPDDCPNAHVPLSMYLLMLVDAAYLHRSTIACILEVGLGRYHSCVSAQMIFDFFPTLRNLG